MIGGLRIPSHVDELRRVIHMKRSQVNYKIGEAIALFDRHSFKLPPWAYWSPQQWAETGDEAEEVRQHQLGWDLTDFGLGDYDRRGLLLFTVRNGRMVDGEPVNAKTYAEKAMMCGPGQVTVWHTHDMKTEDIINRGGGRFVIELAWTAVGGDSLDEARPIEVQCDGITRRLAAREQLVLEPGESVTIPVGLYHTFWGHPDDGPVFVGEVSTVNDDNTDNRFLDPVGRFPTIEEDEASRYLLCTEYGTA